MNDRRMLMPDGGEQNEGAGSRALEQVLAPMDDDQRWAEVAALVDSLPQRPGS